MKNRIIPKAYEKDIVYCKCGCNQQIKYINIYKYKGWPNFINTHQNNIRKGKTNKELFGIEKAEQMSIKPKEFGNKISVIQQGKSFEERFGKEKALEIKQKISKQASRSWNEKFDEKTKDYMKSIATTKINKINKDRIYTKETIKNIIKNINPEKLKKSDFWYTNNFPSMSVINRIFGNIDNMINELNLNIERPSRKEYLKNNPKVLNKILKNSPVLKSYDFEKLHGNIKANKIKNKNLQSRKKWLTENKSWNYGKKGLQEAWNKGLTKEDHPSIQAYAEKRIEYMQNNPGNFISSQEYKICDFLKNENIKFIQQYYIKDINDSYMADIYLSDYNIVIEVDGIYWHNQEGRRELDNKRTEQMLSNGYNVLRFSDKDVDNNMEDIKLVIKEALQW